jgi:hypothetical protein
MASLDIFNEPVRGLVPPEWFHSLSGLERIRDLVAGSAYRFEARGEHVLKGLEEHWRLWAVG